jgi:hypothetical protein
MSSELKATPAQLAEVKLLMPQIDKRINEFQLDVIASSLDHVLFRNVTVREYLPFMTKVARATTDDLVNLVRTINFAKLGPAIQQQIDTAIDLVGYAVQPVFASKEGDPSYAYTIGLNLRVGFELIIVAGFDVELLQTVINKYAALALNHEHIELERNDLLHMRRNEKYGVRTKCIPVEPMVVKQSHMRAIRGEVKRVYQILIADKNNIFPNESGYDQEWRQPYFPRPLY